MSFLQELKAAAERLALRTTRALVGVSGGPDSVALLRGLQMLADSLELQLHVAHLNHGLRPGAADEDAQWVQDLCERMKIPAVIQTAQVQDRARVDGLSIEEAARVARYEFFEQCARELGCTQVVVAHTADDQVETVLHHLLRGTGLAGLRGMPSRRPLAQGITLVRPLLCTSRCAIESWLSEIGQDYRIDATNADERRTRNRIRHRLLPFLEAECPGFRESILRLAEQADETQTMMAEMADRILDSCLLDNSAAICRLNCRRLEDEPGHLVRETFVALWKRQGWPRQAMGFREWDRLYRLVTQGGTTNLPGRIEAIRRGGLITIERQ